MVRHQLARSLAKAMGRFAHPFQASLYGIARPTVPLERVTVQAG